MYIGNLPPGSPRSYLFLFLRICLRLNICVSLNRSEVAPSLSTALCVHLSLSLSLAGYSSLKYRSALLQVPPLRFTDAKKDRRVVYIDAGLVMCPLDECVQVYRHSGEVADFQLPARPFYRLGVSSILFPPRLRRAFPSMRINTQGQFVGVSRMPNIAEKAQPRL